MVYLRSLQLAEIIKTRSVFLLGPRQTGKSTLLRQTFPTATFVDLLDAAVFRRLSVAPEDLKKLISNDSSLVVVDEVQKLPELLDTVQSLIDKNPHLRFVLTGSSARKLKRGHANLLGGRALFCNLHPLVSPEIGQSRLLDRINRSALPGYLDSPLAARDLQSYVGVYLKEEIQAEGLTRSVGNFGRVLEVASLSNTEIINFTKIGNDAQVPPRTVQNYFEILQDTLIAHLLEPFVHTQKRKAVATSKLYYFDAGLARLLRREGLVEEASPNFGKYLEHIVFLELKAYIDYHHLPQRLTFWRSQSQMEVDFLINDEIGIEVKATTRLARSDLKGLAAISEDLSLRRKIVVCRESSHHLADDNVEVWHYDDFFAALWRGEIIY